MSAPRASASETSVIKASAGGAELLLLGGSIYEPGTASSRPCGVAVSAGRIIAVGDEAELRTLAGPETQVVRTDGKLIVPGFQDAHIHPILGGIEHLQCDLSETTTPEECAAAISAYAAAFPNEPWVLGSGWSSEFFEGGAPNLATLDALVQDRPAVLGNRDHHSVWVNSRALEIAGITSDTPDPEDGHIGRSADGTLDGNLYEGAMQLVRDHQPPVTLDLAVRGLLSTQAALHRFGVTTWQDAILGYDLPRELCVDTYLEAERRGALTMRVVGCVWWERDQGVEQIAGIDAVAAQLTAGISPERWRGTGVKVMVDGVTESGTAALSQPYRDAHGHALDHRGKSYFDPDELKHHLVALDAAGYTVHFHALGDRAVTEALDAVEAARTENGDSGLPHHLAHLQLVHPDDYARFAELGAVANLQMFWAINGPPNDDLTIPFVDPQFADTVYPFGALHQAGAPLAAGSDWPVTSPDPIIALHHGVNRGVLGDDRVFGGVAQQLDLATALTAYTAGTAAVNGQSHETGHLIPGYLADLAVIDRDLFAIDAREIGNASVTHTYVGGKLVYSSETE